MSSLAPAPLPVLAPFQEKSLQVVTLIEQLGTLNLYNHSHFDSCRNSELTSAKTIACTFEVTDLRVTSSPWVVMESWIACSISGCLYASKAQQRMPWIPQLVTQHHVWNQPEGYYLLSIFFSTIGPAWHLPCVNGKDHLVLSQGLEAAFVLENCALHLISAPFSSSEKNPNSVKAFKNTAMAEELNRKGSKAYWEGNFARPPELAVNTPTPNPILFELREYEECLKAIVKSWITLKLTEKVPDTNALAVKPATRYTKARYYSNSTSRAKINEDIRKLMERKSKQKEDEKVNELKAWGNLWMARTKPLRQRRNLIMRGIRVSSKRDTLELSHFGHDSVRSLLDGVQQDTSTKMNRKNLNATEKKQIAFLFGGAGDGETSCDFLSYTAPIWTESDHPESPARHVFGALIQAAFQGWTNKWYMTLVEINPASIARILIIFELFSAIGEAKNEEEKDEIFATLIY
ncbi:hypothetical protein FA15DRAFT_662075, partial [Coprinopsis marcescibilis]